VGGKRPGAALSLSGLAEALQVETVELARDRFNEQNLAFLREYRGAKY
jgi:hypothetical protein